MFSIVVGPPTTGKSPAISNTVTKHLSDLGVIISSSTYSGLTKKLSQKGQGFVVNSEIKEFLETFTRKDDNGGCGEAEMLAQLYSGEFIELTYATEGPRTIENAAFSILGKTLST